MYAAAGGASIANRRKQKRLQLSRRGAEAAITAPRIRTHPASSHPGKFARPHVLPPAPTAPPAQQPPPPPPPPPPTTARPPPPPSCAFHSSIDRRRRADKCQQLLLPPVSPIDFPISPPPLSLESPTSVTCAPKTNSFPFPPPSILDLRVSSSTAELQCGGQGPGKAAWQGCNRPSPLPLSPVSPHDSREGYKTKQCEAHRRWMKRNRIRDASYCYGSSGEDDEEDGSNGTHRYRGGEGSAAVNTVLYAGLGTTALGLVISFVGTGEKGFLSPELRLVGPSLLCAGLLCCLFRVLLCLCLCRCGQCRWRFCQVTSGKKDRNGSGIETSTSKVDPRSAGPLPTASLLSPLQRSPIVQSTCPTSSASTTRGNELLLSPAELRD
ncbi:uncharacterized protein [Prorops nasuta]|uniref:uncharacterized protein n=1 Tax=Prorops nasuta TaxID=863751 RepID=UPI0034CF7503